MVYADWSYTSINQAWQRLDIFLADRPSFSKLMNETQYQNIFTERENEHSSGGNKVQSWNVYATLPSRS